MKNNKEENIRNTIIKVFEYGEKNRNKKNETWKKYFNIGKI